MADFTRQTRLEESFQEMHGIKPEVYYLRINNSSYQVKLIFNDKTLILEEEMDKGVTKKVLMYKNGEITPFKSYYEAEVEATKILRS